MTIQKKHIPPPHIDSQQIINLKSMGNIKEISISSRLNTQPTIRPLKNDKYVILSTGEVQNINHHAVNRTENLRNLQKSMHMLSDLINANVYPEKVHCCKFITFTYKENMTNTEKLYIDFRNFNKRFKRYMVKLGYHYEYIVTAEAQERGALHLHGIFIFNQKAPFIDNKIVSEMWGFGFISVKAIDNNIDNIGSYLTAYLTDLPIDSTIDNRVLGGRIKGRNGKHIVKGARLKLLPADMRIYRYSRGIKKPKNERMTYCEAKEQLIKEGFTKTNEYAVEITDDERNFKNLYVKNTYKKIINKELKNNESNKI